MIPYKNANVRFIFVDTGAFVAQYNKDDSHKEEVSPCLGLIGEKNLTLLTSNAVVYETYTRILHDTKGNVEACIKFLEYILDGKIKVLRISEEDEIKAKEVVTKFNDKKGLSLVDALSSVLMEKNNIIKVFTTDIKHFTSMNFLTVPPVSNLLQYLEES